MVGYDERKEPQLPALWQGLAGTLSGMLTRFFGQPLDVLKIRFQLQHEPLRPSPSSYYTSMRQATSRILKEESFVALWKGHVPAQILSGVYGLAQFGSFEVLTKWVAVSHPELSQGRGHKATLHFLCGSVAGALATSLSMPFDTVRTRLVAQGIPKIYTSVLNAFTKMVTLEGVSSLYRGLGPTLLQIVPFAGIQFASFQIFSNAYSSLFLRDNSTVTEQRTKLPVLGNLICGSSSGVVAKICVYPLDLTKKRLQVQGFESARSQFGKVLSFTSGWDVLRKTVKEEGPLGLYKGLTPSLVKALVTTALTFTFYEEISHMLAELRASTDR